VEVLVTGPLWYRVAGKQIGVKEIPGAKSNPTIMSWAKALGAKLGIAYTNDDTPWCGVFVGYCVQAAGFKPPPIAVRAKAWATWGEPLITPTLGCVLVFERPGGGHVGFYAGETTTAYRVLGGNQSNSVNYAWLAKDRCIAMRWPDNSAPIVPTRVVGFTEPKQVSTDEA
jgi:uncharacterized protein (TIGR02594 family)